MATDRYATGYWKEDWYRSHQKRRECQHCGLLQQQTWDIGWDEVTERPTFENLRWEDRKPRGGL